MQDIQRRRLHFFCLAGGIALNGLSHAQGCAGFEGSQAQGRVASTVASDRRVASAYARFVVCADRGDPVAASAALFMLRHGQVLFGSEWSATEGQQARWNALVIGAVRPQPAIVPNDADD